jgi:hypothetical protein
LKDLLNDLDNNKPATAYYKEVDKKHGNFLSVKVYLGE